ncbi:MAG: M28 family peptidase, partial [Pyrinomonadaceae bacterium]
LQVVARRPHPTGSAEHALVRAYIVGELKAMGLEPTIQEATAVTKNSGNGRPVSAATVRNVVVHLEGTDNSKALMLAAHYDSVPTAPGASDDGAGVVTLLETLRALKVGPPLKNDLIIVLTDGEELGLLGARAFSAEHPLMRDVGLVLNFEARGAGGPSMMFETSEGNGLLVGELARAAPHVVANSLMYAVYKRLPNDTDMTVFKGAGAAGLNFAYADRITSYHTALDSVAEIDERSIQHHGSYALALARDFGNFDLRRTRARDAVYFNLPGGVFVNYSETWVVPLTILVTLVFIGVIFLGWKRKRLSLKGLIAGFLALPLSTACAGLVAHASWWTVRHTLKNFGALPYETPYNAPLYEVSLVLIAVAVVVALYAFIIRRVSLQDLAAGALCWWLVLLLLTTAVLPLGAYFFAWPLLCALAGLSFVFVSGRESSGVWKNFAASALGSAPAVVFVVPLLYMLFMMLRFSLVGHFMLLTALLCGMLLPLFYPLMNARRWAIPSASLVAGAALICVALLSTNFDAHRRLTDSIFYHLDSDTNQARWLSVDASPDEWTKQFVPAGAGRESLAAIFPWATQGAREAEAPVVVLPPPSVEVLEDVTGGEVRTIGLRIASARDAPSLLIHTDAGTEVLSATVNGKSVSCDASASPQGALCGVLRLSYAAPPPDGIELRLEVRAARPLRLTVQDVTYELPQVAGRVYAPRPDELMPAPSFRSDNTIVGKTFNF